MLNAGLDPNVRVFERPGQAHACSVLKARASVAATTAIAIIIRPLAADGSSPYYAGVHRGEDYIILVAVCVRHKASERRSEGESEIGDSDDVWHWKGVYEWTDDTHPEWEPQEILIV